MKRWGGLVLFYLTHCARAWPLGRSSNQPGFVSIPSRTSFESAENPPDQRGIVLRISYDGSHFFGWSAANDDSGSASSNRRRRRRRPGSRLHIPNNHHDGRVRSVQGVLRHHLAKVYGDVNVSQIAVEGCSRTDRGVHARGMIAVLHGRNETDGTLLPLPMKGDLTRLAFALNRMLPPDVRIVGIAPTPVAIPGFHPSVSAISKTYIYTVTVGDTFVDPLTNRWAWHCPGQFDLHLAQGACRLVQGRHDFGAFQGAARGKTDKEKRRTCSKICTIFHMDILPKPRDPSLPLQFPSSAQYFVTVTGDRFLYKMVRFLVGAVVEIGMKRKNLQDLQQSLEDPTTTLFTTCAPAHGLVLQEVQYDNSMKLDWQPLKN